MGTLSHVFERQGLATVGLSLHHDHTREIRPPRALLCDFPLGRPLGHPADPEFQHRVLTAAFGLLGATESPTLVAYPESIPDQGDQPVACPLPPRHDTDAPPAVAEARGLRPAWERARAARGSSQVGRVVDADGVPDVLADFEQIAQGVPWTDVALAKSLAPAAMDVRTYYEEAALALMEGIPAARAVETWYYQHTEAGALVRRARDVLQEADPPFPAISYLVPLGQR